MKLFAYACIAGSGSAQSGDYDDRGISNSYYESVSSLASDYYEYDEFGNKKNKNKNKWFDNGQKFGLDLNAAIKPTTNYWDWATALNCWPANIEADQIVYANQLTASAGGRLEANFFATTDIGTVLYPTQQHHGRGPQHVFGSYEILDRAHEASNTNPNDTNMADNTGSGVYESNTNTAHVKNGYFAGYGESAGEHGTANEVLNLHEEDPVLRSGLGGLYQYGHDTWNSQGEMTHNEDMDEIQFRGTTNDTTPIHWTHYKQARHAGCLYEKSEWHYGYATYEQIFLATYFQGYGKFNLNDSTQDWVAAYDDNTGDTGYVSPFLGDDKQGTNEVEPIWWHFFNAHILPNPQNPNCATTGHVSIAKLPTKTREGAADNVTGISYACPTVPNGQYMPGSSTDYLNPETSHAIPLVMANPAYEGLGYLNFIVEYKNKQLDVGQDYLEFIDSTPSMSGTDNYDGQTNSNGFRGRQTYREINNCNANSNATNFAANGAEQECTGWGENLGNWSGVHGMFYYDLFMGSWLIFPAIGRATATDPEHYRTWVSYPMVDSDTAVIFDPSDYNENFSGKVGPWTMVTYDVAAPQATGTSSPAQWSINHDLVVSSFPHNNLGKDFRFNLRVLQGAMASDPGVAADDVIFFAKSKQAVNQVYRSYYFYKINQIDIRFPYYVAYALHHENRGKTLTTDTNDRTDDGSPGAGTDATDWNSAASGAWENGAKADPPVWCNNDAQCHPAGQQWWNTLNNDIVHPLSYDLPVDNADAELYRHMDTTTAKAYNRNPTLSSDDLDDYQFMHVSMAHTRANIIPPVDLGTHSPGVNKHSNTAGQGGQVEFHRVMGFIRAPTASVIGTYANNNALEGDNASTKLNSADWCDWTGGSITNGAPNAAGGDTAATDFGQNLLERTCGVDFRIVGLMNTYDERRGQRGTYQEIWVQLQYALGKGGRDGFLNSCQGGNDRSGITTFHDNDHSGCTAATHPIQSPHPYLHFMASEIISIEAQCNYDNVNNPNLCSQMRMGPGETNNAAYGGK